MIYEILPAWGHAVIALLLALGVMASIWELLRSHAKFSSESASGIIRSLVEYDYGGAE